MERQIWTVKTAKAKLSEILRLARDVGPQRIGERDAYIVVTQADWDRVNNPKPHLGSWLLQNMPELDELELPQRLDREREVPFEEDAM